MAANAIVARFADGRIIKGVSLDVAPERPTCHVRTADGGMHEVALRDLKALFFVKHLDGDSGKTDAQTVDAADPRLRGAKLIECVFHDQERIVGMVMRFPPLKTFFFMVPADPASNNLRILVNRDQVKTMGVLVTGA
jgi:hypothetical protein